MTQRTWQLIDVVISLVVLADVGEVPFKSFVKLVPALLAQMVHGLDLLRGRAQLKRVVRVRVAALQGSLRKQAKPRVSTCLSRCQLRKRTKKKRMECWQHRAP